MKNFLDYIENKISSIPLPSYTPGRFPVVQQSVAISYSVDSFNFEEVENLFKVKFIPASYLPKENSVIKMDLVLGRGDGSFYRQFIFGMERNFGYPLSSKITYQKKEFNFPRTIYYCLPPPCFYLFYFVNIFQKIIYCPFGTVVDLFY